MSVLYELAVKCCIMARLTKAPWGVAFFSTIASQPLSWVRSSWTVEETRMPEETKTLLESGQPVIYALWHARMYSLLKAVPMDKVAILVSPSNDGEFITRIARNIGFQHFIRGSHKRGGTHAILAMKRSLMEENLSVVFMVDGPRGPRYQVKNGIIRLASQTQVPIVPLASAARILLKKFDKSWDHYHAPMPFTPMKLVYGSPLHVPPELSEHEAIEPYRQKLEARLFEAHAEADALYGLRDRL